MLVARYGLTYFSSEVAAAERHLILQVLKSCTDLNLTLLMSTVKNKMRNKRRPREVGGWGRDPKKCTGRDWGMGSSTI